MAVIERLEIDGLLEDGMEGVRYRSDTDAQDKFVMSFPMPGRAVIAWRFDFK